MKKYIVIVSFFALVLQGLSAQSTSWVTKHRGMLKYSYPSNWLEMDFLEANGNVSYGAQYLAYNQTAQLSIMETPNNSGVSDAYLVSDENMNAFFEGIMGSGGVVQGIYKKKLDGRNSKVSIVFYYKDGEHKLTYINTLVLVNYKLLVVQAIFTPDDFEKFMPIFSEVFNSITIK